jgi:hypothetical protein
MDSLDEILEQETRDNMPGQVVGLCGWASCQRLCGRSQHCGLGQARVRLLLGAQRERRKARRLVVGQAIEANIRRAAGSFRAFQLKLAWERQRKGEEKWIELSG